jgi:cell division protein FtsB
MHKKTFLFIFILIFWTFFLRYRWHAPQGIKIIFQLKKKIEKQENKNIHIKKEINELIEETYRLENDNFYIEQLIRDQGLYAYPGEQIIWENRSKTKKTAPSF